MTARATGRRAAATSETQQPANVAPSGEGKAGGDTGSRIAVLDVIRGIAILGTLGTNIWIFTDPAGAAGFLTAIPSGDSLSGAVEQALRFLANGKFLALLSLMFGVGLELQYRSARRRGRRWPGWYLWRAALLFVEGALHYVLVFEFDVLMGYALTSLLVAYLVGRSDRAVRVSIAVAAAWHLLVMALLTAGLLAGNVSLTGGGASALPATADASWLDQVWVRLTSAEVYRAEIVLIVPLGVVLFLLGSRLMRAGLFADDAYGARLRRRLMAVGLGVGVPANLATTYAGVDWFFVDRYVAAPLVGLGLLALVPAVAYAGRRAAGPLRRGFAAVGRTALSCYVLQNLLASVLCYGWGFGLATRLAGAGPWWPVLAWAGICATFMLLAVWWLRRFDRGPLELVWHRAYVAPQRRRRR